MRCYRNFLESDSEKKLRIVKACSKKLKSKLEKDVFCTSLFKLANQRETDTKAKGRMRLRLLGIAVPMHREDACGREPSIYDYMCCIIWTPGLTETCFKRDLLKGHHVLMCPASQLLVKKTKKIA